MDTCIAKFSVVSRLTAWLVVLSVCVAQPLRAQDYEEYEYDAQDSDQNEGYLYEREWVFGVNFNTNGGLIGGIMVRHARVLGPRSYHNFSLELVNIKHPKERREQSVCTGSIYQDGKSNYLYAIRPMYGREWVLFKKARSQGIQINAILSTGPTIGLEAPYLIDYVDGPFQCNGRIQTAQFDPNLHNAVTIYAPGSFFESLGQATVVPGWSLKASMTFEFGTFKRNVTGFEAGVMLDQFSREVEMVPGSENYSFYSSLFLNIFFGSRS